MKTDRRSMEMFEYFDGGIYNVSDDYGFCSNASGDVDSA